MSYPVFSVNSFQSSSLFYLRFLQFSLHFATALIVLTFMTGWFTGLDAILLSLQEWQFHTIFGTYMHLFFKKKVKPA